MKTRFTTEYDKVKFFKISKYIYVFRTSHQYML